MSADDERTCGEMGAPKEPGEVPDWTSGVVEISPVAVGIVVTVVVVGSLAYLLWAELSGRRG